MSDYALHQYPELRSIHLEDYEALDWSYGDWKLVDTALTKWLTTKGLKGVLRGTAKYWNERNKTNEHTNNNTEQKPALRTDPPTGKDSTEILQPKDQVPAPTSSPETVPPAMAKNETTQGRAPGSDWPKVESHEDFMERVSLERLAQWEVQDQ